MRTSVLLLLLAAPAIASAQLYKWVGPDGKVNYTDTPPPKDARRVESRPGQTPAGTGAPLPYALQQAVAANPVVLYTMPDCAPCDEGRSLLAGRGVPVTEKTIITNQDIGALKAISGGTRLPVLGVGKQRQQGYEPGAWNQALTAAGYPVESRLPAGWRNPLPTPLAPAVQAPPKSAETAPTAPAAAEPDGPQGNSPPGFRF